MMENSWFVSRQVYWPDGDMIVEVAQGGSDYANADMLVPIYDGEGEEYNSALEAVEAAIMTRDAWRKDYKGHGDEPIEIGVGFTMGMSLPFSPTDKTDDELRAWGQERDEQFVDDEDGEEW